MLKSKFIRSLVWPILSFIVYGIFRNLINNILAPSFWSIVDIKEGLWLDYSMLFLSALLFVSGWRSKREQYSSLHIGVFLSVLLLILLFWYDSESVVYLTIFQKWPIWMVLFISYTLGLALHHLYEILKHRPTDINLDQFSDVLLFKDIPIDNFEDDKLAFKQFAERIVSSIVKYEGDKTFSIGITGVWGSGKTSVLNLVKKCLLDNKDYIVIEFAPRQSASVPEIQKDFLYVLGEEIAKFHSGALRVTEKYMRAIGALPDSFWAAHIIGTIGNQDVSERRKQLSDIICEVNRKLVILIDDFDRLTGEEIQEVLKLIDKNAAFPKTFFITAYDKTHTNGVISSYQGNNLEVKDYTDKYFNIEISMPVRYPIKYTNLLRSNLYVLHEEGVISANKALIDSSIPSLYPFVYKYLMTVRDVKRYTNLIALSLPPVENDVLLGDFLLTTLIRYRFPDEYRELARYKYTVRKGTIPSEKKFYELRIENTQKVNSKDILTALFSEKRSERGYKSVAHIDSFDHYFYDYDSRNLAYKDLSQILDPSITPETFQRVVSQWNSNDSLLSNLIEFVLSYEKSIHSLDDAKNYLRLFFLTRTYCESRDLYITSLSYLYEGNLKENIKTFSKNDEKEYIGFFRAALNDMYEWNLSVETIHDALHAINTLDTNDIPQMIFSADELMSLALSKLRHAIGLISDNKVSDTEVYRSLRACVKEYYPSGGGEVINPEALGLLRKAMLSNIEFFFNDLLCHKKDESQPSSIQFYLKEGFPLVDLFKNYEGFIQFISDIQDESCSALLNCFAQYADCCLAQNTWTPSLHINGDISRIPQNDYRMYNHLFEGEPIGT